MKPPPVPPEVLEQIRNAIVAGDVDTAQRLLVEHDPKAWKRAQWRVASDARTQLLRSAWAAIREDLGHRRPFRHKLAAGRWSITAKNAHGVRIEVAVVSCPPLRTFDDKPVLEVDIRAPSIVGHSIRALVAPPGVR